MVKMKKTLINYLGLLGIISLISYTLAVVFSPFGYPGYNWMSQKLNKTTRRGIYLFALMNWLSCVGYTLFPLSKSGNAGSFQDIMHIYVVTTLVILLSLISLVMIIVGGLHLAENRALALWALLALIFMILGAIGTKSVPRAFFGIPERFSVFAVTGFNAVLGIYLFNGFKGEKDANKKSRS